LIENSNFLGDSGGGFLVVSGNHNDENTSASALTDTLSNFWSSWVQDAHQSEEDRIALQVHITVGILQHLMSLVLRSVVIAQGTKLGFVRHEERPQSHISHFLHLSLDGLFVSAGHTLDLPFSVQGLVAVLEDVVWSSFDVEDVALASLLAAENGHSLPISCKS
jgi:hypothetical protein